MTATYIPARATIDGNNNPVHRRRNTTPTKTAIGIWNKHGAIADGYALKTAAITNPKIAKTIVSAKIRTDENRTRTRGWITCPAICPIV